MKQTDYLDKDERFKNVEFIQFFKNKDQILVLEGDNINGKSKTDLMKEIGSSRGKSELLSYVIKVKGKSRIANGRMRTFNNNASGVSISEIPSGNVENQLVLSKLQSLEAKINSGINNNPGVTVFTDMIKQSYEIRIQGLNNEIERLKERIDELKDENEELDEEAEKWHTQLQEASGNAPSQHEILFKAVELFTKLKNPGKAAVSNLKDSLFSQPENIPEEIQFYLGAIDWDKITPDQRETVINQFKIFADQLPLKFKEV